jgi:hypothetical protein
MIAVSMTPTTFKVLVPRVSSNIISVWDCQCNPYQVQLAPIGITPYKGDLRAIENNNSETRPDAAAGRR